MTRLLPGVLASLLACACGGSGAEPPRSPASAVSAWETEATHGDGGSSSKTIDAAASPAALPHVVPIVSTSSAEGPARPARVPDVDVHVVGASLHSVFRLLADVGRFSLVIDGAFGEEISLDLNDVDPYEALLVLAESRGASVTHRDGIVIVSGAER